MEKIDVNTALAIFFVATAVMIIGGLALIPALEEAQADKDTKEAAYVPESGGGHSTSFCFKEGDSTCKDRKELRDANINKSVREQCELFFGEECKRSK